MSNIEQTLSIIKPDAVERNLEKQIKSFFDQFLLKCCVIYLLAISSSK